MVANSKETKTIHKLLKQTIIEPYIFAQWLAGNQSAYDKRIKPLADYFEYHVPPKLYRMRAITDNAVRAFEEDNLFLTRADLFNDPYDCLLSFNTEKLHNKVQDSISEEHMRQWIRRNNITFPMGNLFNTMEDLLTSLSTYRKEFLKELPTFLSSVPGELQSNTYIACMTENIESPVMWAHYANNHTGFSIEYQFLPDIFAPKPMLALDAACNWYGWRSLLPVIYSDSRADGSKLAEWYLLCKWTDLILGEERLDVDMTDYISDLLLKTKLCLHKAQEWAYEREWRLMISHNWPNRVGAQAMHMFCPPTAIYLGERISEKDRKLLKELSAKKDIPVYQMYTNPTTTEYKMNYTLDKNSINL